MQPTNFTRIAVLCTSLFASTLLHATETKMLTLERSKINHVLSEPLLKRLIQLFNVEVFVETGTWHGNSTAVAAPLFKEVHTVELGEELHKKACRRFAAQPHVHVHLGDSGKIFPTLLPTIKGRMLFWLDGHYSCGDTALGDEISPILQELTAIKNAGIHDAVIMIDDIRLFSHGTMQGEYPASLDQVKSIIMSIDPTYQFIIFGDTAIAFPAQDNVRCSAVILACTESRMTHCTYDDIVSRAKILHAEQIIAQAEGQELETLTYIYNDFATAAHRQQTSYGRYYDLWSALNLMNHKNYTAAATLLTNAKNRGWQDWRIDYYLNQIKS